MHGCNQHAPESEEENAKEDAVPPRSEVRDATAQAEVVQWACETTRRQAVFLNAFLCF